MLLLFISSSSLWFIEIAAYQVPWGSWKFELNCSGADPCSIWWVLNTINSSLHSVQGTSVLSPFLHIGSVITLAAMIYKKSTVQLFEKHPCLYILTFGFVSAKITNKLVVSTWVFICFVFHFYLILVLWP